MTGQRTRSPTPVMYVFVASDQQIGILRVTSLEGTAWESLNRFLMQGLTIFIARNTNIYRQIMAANFEAQGPRYTLFVSNTYPAKFH